MTGLINFLATFKAMGMVAKLIFIIIVIAIIYAIIKALSK